MAGWLNGHGGGIRSSPQLECERRALGALRATPDSRRGGGEPPFAAERVIRQRD